jgi:hypothetical protein
VRRVKYKAQIDVLLLALDTLPRCIVERTVPMIFSAGETTDVGREAGTPVASTTTATAASSPGKIDWVRIDLGKHDVDHMISSEERLRVAMARQ